MRYAFVRDNAGTGPGLFPAAVEDPYSRRIAERAAALSGLTMGPLPIELETVPMVLAWHGRHESSHAQGRLREVFPTEAGEV